MPPPINMDFYASFLRRKVAKENDFPERGPGLPKGPTPLPLLAAELQIAQTQLDADGKISDLEGLKSIVKTALRRMKVDPDGARELRSSLCGSNGPSASLRASLPDIDKVCGLKVISPSVPG